MKNNISEKQKEIITTIHKLVWFRITNDEKYLKAIPDIDSKHFHDHIYYMTYRFVEYEDSQVDAIIYLNGQHYHYTNTPQFNNNVWASEISVDQVEDYILAIGGEIYEGFEIYNPDDLINYPKALNATGNIDEGLQEYEYDDLPF